jgi:signal transduction histidine kinase
MRERVRHLKGVMDIQSNGTGATISVTFPVPTSPTSISTSGSDGIVASLKATG